MIETAECEGSFKRPRIWINQAAVQCIIVKLAYPASCTLWIFYWLIDFIIFVSSFPDIQKDFVWRGLRGISVWMVFLGLISLSGFIDFRDAAPYNLRNADLSSKTRYSTTNTLKFSFFPRTVRAWNNLPTHIRKSDSLPEFKRLCKAHLCQLDP